MGIQMRGFLLFSMVMCLIYAAHAEEGLAVYYDPPYTPSACFGIQNMGIMVAGVADPLWDGSAACGKWYRVTCIGPANEAPHPCKNGTHVDVIVVDYCRPPCNGIFDLSRDAFSDIADLDAGIVKVQYELIQEPQVEEKRSRLGDQMLLYME